MIIITVFAVIVFGLSLTPGFYMPKYRKWRGLSFLLLGICAGIPIIYIIIFKKKIKGFNGIPKLHHWYVGGIIYILGGLIYMLRIPEKICPGKFDYVGASHQFLHLCVDVGIILHYLGSINSYYYRLRNECPAAV